MAAVRLALAMLAMATLALGVNVMCSDPELNELISTTEVPAPPLIAPARRCALALRARPPAPLAPVCPPTRLTVGRRAWTASSGW